MAETSNTDKALAAHPRLRLALPAAALFAALLGAPAQGQPATSRMVPDFSGAWAKNGDAGSRYEQPASGPGPLVNTTNDRHIPIGNYDSPILKPWAAALVKAHGEAIRAGKLATDAHTMCLPMGVPYILQVRDVVQVLQKPERVMIVYENNAAVRDVRLNAQHSAHPVPSGYGESVGHYEGDTLVVDTIGIARYDFSTVDRFGTPYTDALHVVERYRVTDGGKTLRVDFTVEDPGTFTTKWSGWTSYPRVKRVFGEHVCAENNREAADGHLQIPTAATPDF